MTTSKIAERVESVLTPALFAARVSQGRWKMVKHLAAIDRAIVETIRGVTAPILIIEAPPRHGKSELVSRYLPAWYLGMFPSKRVLLVGYGATFARSWGRKARTLLTEHGCEAFGVEVSREVRAAAEWNLAGCEGGMVTSGVGGPLTGRGANLLIVDDPIKNSEEANSETLRDRHWDWWQTTASTRIEPGGCAIIMATRWNYDDLSGRLIEAAETGAGIPVRRLRLPAIAEKDDPLGRRPGEALWPERWPLDRLEKFRLQKEARWWQAMYQQRPGLETKSHWPRSYFDQHIWTDWFPSVFEISAIAVDPAQGKKKGDYSALVFAGSAGGVFWIDAVIERQPPEQMVSLAIDMALRYAPHAIVLEANFFQSMLAPEFDRQCRDRRLAPLPLQSIVQSGNKEQRIQCLGPSLLQHKLRFCDTPGCRRLVQQLRDFPTADHDDGPDALELAIRSIRYTPSYGNAEQEMSYEFARA